MIGFHGRRAWKPLNRENKFNGIFLGDDDSNEINKVGDNKFITDTPIRKPFLKQSPIPPTSATEEPAPTTVTTQFPKIDLRSGLGDK